MIKRVKSAENGLDSHSSIIFVFMWIGAKEYDHRSVQINVSIIISMHNRDETKLYHFLSEKCTT